MSATAELTIRATHMPEPKEPDTKTARIAGDIANKLQTISALKKEMGEKFSAVDFLNDLLAGPVEELHETTVAAYTDFKAKNKKKK